MNAIDAAHLSAHSSSNGVPDSVTARGSNGQITVDDRGVRIRKGLLTRTYGVRGERSIAPDRVAAVHLQPPTAEAQGRLELRLKETNGRARSLPAVSDEHTIRFAPASAAAFEQVRTRLESLLQTHASASPNGR